MITERFFRPVFRFLKGMASVTVRAVFMIFNGVIIGGFISFIPGLGVIVPIGVILQLVLDHFHIRAVSGLGLTYFCLLSAFDAIVIIMMFIGKYLGMKNDGDDRASTNNAFDLLFMMYGCFIFFTSLLSWLYYHFDPSIFVGTDVTFWRVFLYVLELSITGFVQDIMEHVHIEPILNPAGVMYHVAFVIKMIMIFTVVSGLTKYIEITKGKGGS
jgi:hypothetical protein